jgi:hypothetical protein
MEHELGDKILAIFGHLLQSVDGFLEGFGHE